jgi:hypothetical protein
METAAVDSVRLMEERAVLLFVANAASFKWFSMDFHRLTAFPTPCVGKRILIENLRSGLTAVGARIGKPLYFCL